MTGALRLVGAYGSPYSRKMRAVLRYRRIPFRWVMRGGRADRDLPAVPVDLIPVLVFADGDEAMIDSTPMIRRLEAEHEGRRVVSPDPALAFLDALIEDYADEWLTKAMFHYRWWYEADIRKAARVLPVARNLKLTGRELEDVSRAFAERQIGRLGVVGSSEATRDVIERSYRRLLLILDDLIREQTFVMGGRPGAADFGIYGQLSQLALFDPTPVRVCEEVAPRLIAWTQHLDDASWVEVDDSDWLSREDAAEALLPLVDEIGRVYVPFLLANAAALASRKATVRAEIDGCQWTQRSFPYQGKCLARLRELHAGLAKADRKWVDGVLADSGCEALFEDPVP